MARVLITRAMPEAEETARLLSALGHAGIVAPLRRTQPVAAALPQARPQALVATSRKAFTSGEAFPADWRDIPTFCVGQKTAEAARLAGFSGICVADGDSGSLVETITRHGAGAALLYLAGEPRGSELEQRLQAAGFALQTLLRYRMIRVERLPEAARRVLAARACDAVLHFSPESARAYFELASAAGLAPEAARPIQACLSPAVAAAARRSAGRDLDLIVAPERHGESLIATLHARLGSGP